MRRRMVNSVKFLLVMCISGYLFSCAGVFKGMRSSNTKKVSKSPYYDGKLESAAVKVGHLPVTMDIRLKNAFMEGDRRFALEPLIWEMNKFLDSLKLSATIPSFNLKLEDAPDIYVGNEYGEFAPTNRIGIEGSRDTQNMVIYRYDPSKKWKAQLSQAAKVNNIEYVLVITVGFGEYFLKHKNVFGKVILDLGTGYEVTASWFTDTDTPAEVLHVTGALVNKEGKIIRAGSEGIISKKTGFFTNMVGMRDMLSEEDLEKILHTEQRKDLPGKPLKWKVALQNLVAQLTENRTFIVK